jgi:hypothetical protein
VCIVYVALGYLVNHPPAASPSPNDHLSKLESGPPVERTSLVCRK